MSARSQARAFSSLELGIALHRAAPDQCPAERTTLESLVAAASLSDPLKVRLGEALAVEQPGFLTNGQLDLEERIALTGQLERGLAAGPISTEAAGALRQSWAAALGLHSQTSQWISKQLTSDGLMRGEGSPFERFWHAPKQAEQAYRRYAERVRMGSDTFRPFSGRPARRWQHRRDVEALRSMKSVTGFDKVLRAFSSHHVERIERIRSQTTRIQVTPKQLPRVYRIWREALDRTELREEPILCVDNSGMNAYTTGVEEKQVVLGSSLVSLLEPRELLFVLGHELGHIRCEHVLYSMLAMNLPWLAEVAGAMTLGIGSLLGHGLQLAVMNWYRCAELSCDRHGLLVAQDQDAATRVLMKLTGAPPSLYRDLSAEEFIRQGAGFKDGSEETLGKAYRFFLLSEATHPWPAVRAHELSTWVEDGSYESLLLKSQDQGALEVQCSQAATPEVEICPGCGQEPEVGDSFCTSCGGPLQAARG